MFGAVRVKGVKTSFLFRNTEDQEFEEYSSTSTGEPGWSPAFISNDRQKWYVSSRIDGNGQPRDKAGLFRFDPATRKVGELVYVHPEVDVGSAISSRVRDDLVCASTPLRRASSSSPRRPIPADSGFRARPNRGMVPPLRGALPRTYTHHRAQENRENLWSALG